MFFCECWYVNLYSVSFLKDVFFFSFTGDSKAALYFVEQGCYLNPILAENLKLMSFTKKKNSISHLELKSDWFVE